LNFTEDQEAKLNALRAALIAGEESGSTPFDFDKFISAKCAIVVPPDDGAKEE
jgi:hypothetical protein